jgi:hypothetical protein
MVTVTADTQTGHFQNTTAFADNVQVSLCCLHEIITVKHLSGATLTFKGHTSVICVTNCNKNSTSM